MSAAVSLGLFAQTRHSPSFLTLQRNTERELRDWCIPVNPYFPPPELFAQFRARLESVLKYYPAPASEIAEVLAGVLQLDPETLVLANGSTELLTWLDVLLARDSLVTPVPTFGRWTDHPRDIGARLYPYPLLAEHDFALDVDDFVCFVRGTGARAVAVCNPNNPTGSLLSRGETVRLLDALGDLDLVVIDESFLDFAHEAEVPTVSAEAARRENVVVLKSLGKNFGLHGVRAGYAVTNVHLATRLRRELPSWNVNGLAELLIRELPHYLDVYEQSRRRVVRDRVVLERRLREVDGLTVYPSCANFVYVRAMDTVDGTELRDRMLTEHGILLRECGNKIGSDRQHFRIAARPAEQVAPLIEALRACLSA